MVCIRYDKSLKIYQKYSNLKYWSKHNHEMFCDLKNIDLTKMALNHFFVSYVSYIMRTLLLVNISLNSQSLFLTNTYM